MRWLPPAMPKEELDNGDELEALEIALRLVEVIGEPGK